MVPRASPASCGAKPFDGRRVRDTHGVAASYAVNEPAVCKARELIDAHQYVLTSDWGDTQPGSDAQNAYLEEPLLGRVRRVVPRATDGATDATKGRYAFVYGDFRRVHRMGLIACVYRASEWRHKAIELAAHDLLQRLDAASA